MGKVIEVALKYLGFPGVRYEGPTKGRTPKGFTCSGFVEYVLNEAGFAVPPWHSNEFFDKFGVLVHEGLQRSGDLVFMSKDGIRPTHVEFYVDDKTLSELLDKDTTRLPKEKVETFLKSTRAKDFILGSPGRDNSNIRLAPLTREKITPNPKSPHFPQLYNSNPIGYKRPANLDRKGRYHRFE